MFVARAVCRGYRRVALLERIGVEADFLAVEDVDGAGLRSAHCAALQVVEDVVGRCGVGGDVAHAGDGLREYTQLIVGSKDEMLIPDTDDEEVLVDEATGEIIND